MAPSNGQPNMTSNLVLKGAPTQGGAKLTTTVSWSPTSAATFWWKGTFIHYVGKTPIPTMGLLKSGFPESPYTKALKMSLPVLMKNQ